MRRYLVAALALVLPAAAAFAFVRTQIPSNPGTCLYWQPRTLSYQIAQPLGGPIPDARAIDEIRESFAQWEAPSCSDLSFREGARTNREVGYFKSDNANVILFRDRDCNAVVPRNHACRSEGNCAAEFDCWEIDYGATTIAITTSTFSPCTGQIFDGDIELNAAFHNFTTGDVGVDTDLRNTLVHEIGHMIGLAHSRDSEATMFATARKGETGKRDLASDDVEGLCTMYPAGRAARTCPRAEANCPGGGVEDDGGGCTTAEGGVAGGLGLVALVLAAGWLRRGGRGAAVPGGASSSSSLDHGDRGEGVGS